MISDGQDGDFCRVNGIALGVVPLSPNQQSGMRLRKTSLRHDDLQDLARELPERYIAQQCIYQSNQHSRAEQAVGGYVRHPFGLNKRERLSSGGSHSSEGSLDTHDADLEVPNCLLRPDYMHAATHSFASERPRLADIVQNYSATQEEIWTRTLGSRRQETEQPAHDASLSEVPTQQVNNRATAQTIKRKERKGKRPVTSWLQASSSNRRGGNMTGGGTINDTKSEGNGHSSGMFIRQHATNSEAVHEMTRREPVLSSKNSINRRMAAEQGVNLRRRSHVSLQNAPGFNLPRTYKSQPVARDWSPSRKKFVAAVACLGTALIGILLGIYTGLVPSIQYYIIDQSHVTVHGNTGCFLALALPTFFLWPLPLLHGRKPYIMCSLIIAMPLLFPQAIAVSSQRLTNTASWRATLLTSRTLMGGALGFASMNFHSILTDLFGASLMSQHPHQEVADRFDARRHGGGMGVWLGIWTWCWIGSFAIGFLIGATIIDKHPPAWGFYISIILVATVLVLNVACPEVRRSAYRRSVAEVRAGEEVSRRLARGEVMMHRIQTGPKWWGQEAYQGVLLSFDMLKQPGFAVMALYVAWIYAQIVLVVILLGSLTSRFYRLRSPYVGLVVAVVAFGALLAIPFQKASFFSRSRNKRVNASRRTFERKVAWSSHLIRRALFTVSLPICSACYAAVSSGPPMSLAVPTIFALCTGFLSSLAIAECNGIIMETFDTSDLSAGMVGQQRDPTGETVKRINYSSFPRVSAGFAIIHTFAYILAAGSTALGGHITRTLGQRVTTSLVAGILLVFTIMLLLVLLRFKNVLIIPRSKSAEMDRLTQARRSSTKRRESMPNDTRTLMEEDNAWCPAMMGNPTGKTRRMNILELGSMTRWQDIRRKNQLIDAGGHVDCAALNQGLEALDTAVQDQFRDLRRDAQGLLRKASARKLADRLRRSNRSSEQTTDIELDVLDSSVVRGGIAEAHQMAERECVIGQTVKEENEDEAQANSNVCKLD